MTDLKVFGNTYSNVKGIKATDTDDATITFGEGGGVIQDAEGSVILDDEAGEISGRYSIDDIALGRTAISGDIVIGLSGNQFLRNYAFEGTSITSVSAPNLVRCYNNCFQGCTSLVTADLPVLHETDARYGGGLFVGCSALTSINMPYIKQGCIFDGCSSLVSYTNKRPATETANSGFSNYQFRNCSSLTIIDYTYLSQFGASAGWGNTNSLETVVLRRSDSIVPLDNAGNVPTRMLENGAGVTVYVPSALISTYQTATNWSTVHGYGTITWTAIEDSYYETHYADGTEIPT